MNVIIFFIILLVLVIAHEFGHFFAAKKFGIRVDEFGFGFPPKIAGIKKGETEYTFNALPFGGFVKIFGENPDEDSLNGPDKDRSFVNKPRWKQAIVLFAGVFANFVVAWILFSIGFISGLPTSVDSVKPGENLTNVNLVVVSVAPNTPAEEGGLMSGDKLISVKSGEHLLSPVNTDTMKKFIVAHENKEIDLLTAHINKRNNLHFQDREFFGQNKIYYDRTCQKGSCFASLEGNLESILSRFKIERGRYLFIVRDFTYLNALKKRDIQKARASLSELEQIITKFLEIQKNDGEMLLLITSSESIGFDFPRAGTEWASFEKKGDNLGYKSSLLMSLVLAKGAGAENFCGIYKESEILERILKSQMVKRQFPLL